MAQNTNKPTTHGPTLDTFIKNNRQFIKIKAGETFRGVYRGFEQVVVTSFGQKKEAINYLLQEHGTERVVPWQSSSLAVADKMKNFSVGEEIIIKRTGSTATDTKYEILPADSLAA